MDGGAARFEQAIVAIEDLRETIDVDKLGQLREREEVARRELERAWRGDS